MQRYILVRILQGIVAVLAAVTIIFFAIRLTGDPAILFMSDYATEEDAAALRAHMGLDKPVAVQYGLYLLHGVRGDFGESIRAQRPAMEVVLERLPATMQLAGVAILVALIIALPIGVYAAVRRGGFFDGIARSFAILGQSMPAFWLGIMLILIFAVVFQVLPAGGRRGPESFILPAIVMGWYISAGIMRITRSSMIDVLGSEYVKLARIKGLHESLVIWKHAFKNAALPVLTFGAIMLVGLLRGSIIVETVFSWPGVGRLVIDAIGWRDFPVIQATVVLLATLYITTNLIVDILYAYLNPKIRYQK